MKRIFIIFSLLIITLCSFGLETKKVAILEVVDREDKLSYFQKLMLRTLLAEEVNKAKGFEAYDRTNINAILGEHNFQRSGLVSEEQIRKLGEMVGAAYILVIEGATSSKDLFVSASIMDVETAKLAVTANEKIPTSEEGMQKGCASLAKKLFDKLQEVSDDYIKEEKRIQEKQKETERREQSKYFIHRVSSKEYSYRGEMLDKNAYAQFLKNNCPEAYKEFNKGKKLKQAGWVCFGIGLATMAGSGLYRILLENRYKQCENSPYWNDMSDDMRRGLNAKYDNYSDISYIIMGGVGGGLILTSFPLFGAGVAKQKKSVSLYNDNCSSFVGNIVSFNLISSQNGIGMALQF